MALPLRRKGDEVVELLAGVVEEDAVDARLEALRLEGVFLGGDRCIRLGQLGVAGLAGDLERRRRTLLRERRGVVALALPNIESVVGAGLEHLRHGAGLAARGRAYPARCEQPGRCRSTLGSHDLQHLGQCVLPLDAHELGVVLLGRSSVHLQRDLGQTGLERLRCSQLVRAPALGHGERDGVGLGARV